MEVRNKNMIIADMENDEPISFHINKENKVFAVPDNYFSEFPAKILFNIRLENMDKSVPYAVPEQYFSEFPDKILKRIEDEETPVLKTVSKENVYAVQGNYFENFSRQITKKIKEENDEVKVIPLRTKRKRWQMTAAAAVVAAAVLSSSLFLENRKSAREHEHQYYASVLNDGDSSNVGGFDQDLSGLSNSEINDYLASPNFSDSCITESANEQATQREISEMSNEAMESYLNQTPTVY